MKTSPSAWKDRCDQFIRDEAAKKTPQAASKGSGNPYMAAKAALLAKYPDWRRTELLAMETAKDTDNRFYTEFVQEIIRLAETP